MITKKKNNSRLNFNIPKIYRQKLDLISEHFSQNKTTLLKLWIDRSFERMIKNKEQGSLLEKLF